MPRRPNSLSTERMRELARMGAETAIKDLRTQIAAIERAFPGLRRSGGARHADGATADQPQGQRRRRRSGMSAAARKAVSLRMKKYWAERRKPKRAGR